MAGSRHGWPSRAVGVVFLAGCVGLGNFPSDTETTKRPRARSETASTTYVAAQAGNDIPLVPVPPPPTANRNPPAAKAESGQQKADSGPQMADGTTPTANRNPPAAKGDGGSRRAESGQRTADSGPRMVDGATPTTQHTARQLLQQAADRCARLDTYIVRLTRRENLKGKVAPEEIIAFSFRKQPFSVHFKWLGKTAEGREVVYVKGRFESKIHTKVAAGDSLLLPAGARLSLSPDNPLVRAASRHPITDAGICHCVEALTSLLDAQERGDRRRGTLSLLAPQQRPEYPQPVETLEYLIPTGVEPDLQGGGRRLIYFDPDWRLPMLVSTSDDKGNEVEYYRFDRLMTPANLDDDDFNPDKLWPKSDAPQKRGDASPKRR